MVKGEKKTSKRKFFPGYILVQMDDERPHLAPGQEHPEGHRLRRCRCQSSSRRRSAMPKCSGITTQISEGTLKPKPRVQFTEADTVRVIDGPFANFNGTVEEVNPEKGRIRVLCQHLRSRHARRSRLHAGREDRRVGQRLAARALGRIFACRDKRWEGPRERAPA